MYSNTISLRYFFPRPRILNEIAEFEKMPLNRKTLSGSWPVISTCTHKCVFIILLLVQTNFNLNLDININNRPSTSTSTSKSNFSYQRSTISSNNQRPPEF